MNRFYQLLVELDRKIKLKSEDKNQILEEIAADLEDLYQTFLEEGLTPEEAELKAIDFVDLSDESLQELQQVHMGWTDKLMDNIDLNSGKSWKTKFILVVFFLLFFYLGRVVFSDQFFNLVSPLVIPTGVISIILMWIAIRKGVELFVLQSTDDLRKGMKLYFTLLILNLCTGFYGLISEIYVSGRKVIGSVYEIVKVGQNAEYNISSEVVLWGLRSSAIVILSFFSTIFFVIVWFFLVSKINNVERKKIKSLFAHAKGGNDE